MKNFFQTLTKKELQAFSSIYYHDDLIDCDRTTLRLKNKAKKFFKQEISHLKHESHINRKLLSLMNQHFGKPVLKFKARDLKEFNINPNQLKIVGQGASGSYFKLNSKLGMKLISVHDNSVTSEKKLQKNILWEKSTLESQISNYLEELYGITPKVYKLIVVRDLISQCFSIGIVMDHISGKTLTRVSEKTNKIINFSNKKIKNHWNLRLEAEKMLLDVGIVHGDLHTENMIVKRDNSVAVIDFGHSSIDQIK